MKKYLAALSFLLLATAVQAEPTKILFNPFTGKMDYIVQIDTNTIVAGTGIDVTDNGDGTVTVATTGGGSASTLAFTTGTSAGFNTVITSPTVVVVDDGDYFIGSLTGGGTYFRTVDTSTFTLLGPVIDLGGAEVSGELGSGHYVSTVAYSSIDNNWSAAQTSASSWTFTNGAGTKTTYVATVGSMSLVNPTNAQVSTIFTEDLPINGGVGPQVVQSSWWTTTFEDSGVSGSFSIIAATGPVGSLATGDYLWWLFTPPGTGEGSASLNLKDDGTIHTYSFGQTEFTIPASADLTTTGIITGLSGIFSSSLEMPQANVPTLDAIGEIALDDDITAMTPLVAYATSTTAGTGMYVIAVSSTVLHTISDNDIVKYDAASSAFVLEADADSGGGGGGGYNVEPATVTFQLDIGVTATTGTFTDVVSLTSASLDGGTLNVRSTLDPLSIMVTENEANLVSVFWEADLTGTTTQMVGVFSKVTQTSASAGPLTDAIGVYGWARDETGNNGVLEGVEGRVTGQGVAPTYIGVLGAAEWISDLSGGTTSTIVGLQANVTVTDGSSVPIATGTVYQLYLPAPTGSGADGQTWAIYAASTHSYFLNGDIGLGWGGPPQPPGRLTLQSPTDKDFVLVAGTATVNVGMVASQYQMTLSTMGVMNLARVGEGVLMADGDQNFVTAQVSLSSSVTGSLPAASIAAGSLGSSVIASSIAVNSVESPNIVVDTIVAADIDETVDYSFVILSDKQLRNSTAVDDDSCVGEQGTWWYDTTDSQFEFCNANSGAPAAIPTTPGDITDVYDCATGDCNTMTVESGESLTFAEGGEIDATDLRTAVYNNSGGTIFKCSAVYISGFNVPNDLPEIGVADSDNAAQMPSIGLLSADIADAASGFVDVAGELDSADTTTGEAWTVGDSLYVNASGTSGSADCGVTLTNVLPTGESSLLQKIGQVVRVNASNGRIEISGAGRINATPNLDDAAIFIGNASNNAAAVDVTGDVSITNAGVTTVDNVAAANIAAGSLGASVQGSSVAVGSIDDTAMAAETFGDWTCDSTEDGCTLDGGVVAAAEMADADHGDVSWTSNVATVDNIAAANVAAGNLGTSVVASSMTEHASTHENAGHDEISVAGLSGELADPQPVQVSTSTTVMATTPLLAFEGATIVAHASSATITLPGSGDMLLGTAQAITAQKTYNDDVAVAFGTGNDSTLSWVNAFSALFVGLPQNSLGMIFQNNSRRRTLADSSWTAQSGATLMELSAQAGADHTEANFDAGTSGQMLFQDINAEWITANHINQASVAVGSKGLLNGIHAANAEGIYQVVTSTDGKAQVIYTAGTGESTQILTHYRAAWDHVNDTAIGTFTGNYVQWDSSGVTQGFVDSNGGISIGSATVTGTITGNIDAEATGTQLTIPSEIVMPLAVCASGATGSHIFNTGVSSIPAAGCVAQSTSTVAFGTVDFDDTIVENVQYSFPLPSDWTGNIDLDLYWVSTSTFGTVVWSIETGCAGNDEDINLTLNTAQTFNDAAVGNPSATHMNTDSQTSVTTTGCAADDEFFFIFGRDADNGSDTMTGDARAKSIRWTIRRAI